MTTADPEPRQFGVAVWAGAKHSSCQPCAKLLGAAWVPVARVGACEGCGVELEAHGPRPRMRW